MARLQNEVIGMLPVGEGELWHTFFCPGCQCNHHFTKAWQWNGDRVKPTVKPSILVNGDLSNPSTPRCHIFITDGRIQYLADCTHSMAGQTVDMETDF